MEDIQNNDTKFDVNDQNRQPLIEPLPTINEYINMRFPIIIVIALTFIAMILMFIPQVFTYIFGSCITEST